MTARDPIGFDEPPFTLPPEPQRSRAWDYPLTWIVLIALGMAAGFVFTLAVAGWLA